MNRTVTLIALLTLLFCNTTVWADENTPANCGIEFGFGVTGIYQQNVKGGTDTHSKRGRFSGSYDLEMQINAQKFFGIEGGEFFIHAEGSWPKEGGIDSSSIASVFGVNGDAAARRSMDITEFWYEQSMLEGTLLVRLGKMDLTGGFECSGCPVAFDTGNYANDETSQFLNSALVNNPTIPFPDYALGIAAYYNPVNWWYAAASVVDAQNDKRETGFRTALHKQDYFFYVFETGLITELNSANGSLPGAYRIGFWNDAQPKANTDRADAGKSYRDDVGVYTSCDQMLVKENADPADQQGLGGFVRYGYAPSKSNDITNFYSFGFQYQGPLDGRDDDVAGAAFAYGDFSNSADSAYPEGYESALEVYYNARVNDWLNISPSLQYVANPGGVKTAKDTLILGLRAQMNF